MSQISRPFQIALLAVAVLGAAWLFVFQPHSSNTATSSSSAAVVSAPPPTASAGAKAASSRSKIYHGSAPGVQGLTRAVAHAHEAVATSQKNAHTLEQKAAQASGGQPSTSAASATPTGGASATKSAATPTQSTPSGAKTSKPAPKSPASRPTEGHSSIPAGQHRVETELAHGNIVVVLFWNHNGADDEVVHRELKFLQTIHHRIKPYANRPLVKRLLKAFGLELDKKIAIDIATPSQTASFGSITRGVQVYGTPTMLVIDKHGHAIVLNGLQDTFSIEQAIDEARHVA